MSEKKNLPATTNKLTLDEYKAKYSKPQNVKAARFFLVLFAAGIGVVIFTCLLLIVLKIYDINNIAGYISIAPALAVFIIFYVVPLVKINSLPTFQTVVDERNAKAAQVQNRKIREQLADGMIHFASNTDNIGWYDETRIGRLAVARQTNNNEDLKKTLSEIFDTDVRKQARGTITKAAVNVGLLTAISQDDKLDSAIIAMFELNLVKDLLFLYGFRPSDARLAKIFGTVVSNALVAYGFSQISVKATSGLLDMGLKLATAAGKNVAAIGALAGVISTVVGSASQGIVNGILTTVIGKQTQKYLMLEYHLQDVLDGIVLDDEDEAEIVSDVKKGITQALKDVRKKDKDKDGKEKGEENKDKE